MNIQQCRYVVAISQFGSFREAAKQLYVAQSSLSSAVKDLETELNIMIFTRSQRGVQLTEEGAEFLEHANKILSQVDIVETRYKGNQNHGKRFSVSSQHYDFASEAFSQIVMDFKGEYEEFCFKETDTMSVLEDLKGFESEIGLLFLNDENRRVLKQYLKDFHLTFNELGSFATHVFLGKNHPLANKTRIDMNELKEYPLIRFTQEGNSSDYFSEDILAVRDHQQVIFASDRGTVVNLLSNTDGYLIGSGILRSQVRQQLVVLPLKQGSVSKVGWIQHQNRELSVIGKAYISLLEGYFFDFII